MNHTSDYTILEWFLVYLGINYYTDCVEYVKNDYFVGDNRNSVFEYDCVKTDKRYYLYYAYINGKVDNTYEIFVNNIIMKVGE